MNGYWFYTIERFFYLEELVRQHKLTDLFHLESDVMLYCDLEELLPVFQARYSGMIGATFEGFQRGIPGFFYIQTPEPMQQLVSFFASRSHLKEPDIDMIDQFGTLYGKQWIDALPILPPDYPLNSELFSNHFTEFSSLFDAAAYGIYLGGVDCAVHENWYPGQDHPNSIFKASHFTFQWKEDEKGRWVPFAMYNGKEMRLNNLHATCKRLDLFYSLNRESPLIQGRWEDVARSR